MKSENILRAARNSLLCFSMALGAGFLVACGSDTPAAPPAPTALSASVQSENEILVTWSAVPRATSYNLYRSTSRDGTVSLVAGNISALSYLDATALSAEDIDYYYQLEACNSGGCSSRSPIVLASREFSVYLSDSAAEGVEYSGPNGSNGLTWKGGVFSATKGVFEFSIADTTLGRVSLNIDWANAHVTPADFIGVDEQKVIDIARVMQGLDEDTQSAGISVSRRARTDVRGDLFDEHALLFAEDDEFDIFSAAYRFPSREYTIPTKNVARDHFVATRKCLFSGVYDGDYRITSPAGSDDRIEGQIYYAIQPFADRATGVKFSNENPGPIENRGITTALSGPVDIGVIGSGTITFSKGNELSFVTPRVVAGIWQEVNQEGGTDITVSGTSALTLAEGNPGATRRIVGVEKVDGGERVLGLYALDYFGNEGPPSGNFRGRYYDVTDNQNFALLLTIAGGAFWPTDATPTMLTLIGTRDDEGSKVATAITLSVTRNVNVNGNRRINENREGDDNDGSFGGTGIGVSGAPGVISGTWCDISGATGVANPLPLPQSPKAPPRAVAASPTRIDIAWDYPIEGARTYNLYRIIAGEPPYSQVLVDGGIETRGYRDTGLAAGTEYSYQLEVCNTSGCSARSPEVSATTLNPEVSETTNPTP